MAFAGFVRKAAAAAFVAVAAVLSSCGGGGDLPTPQIDSQRASAQAQLTALRSAHGEAVRALARLKTGTGAATRAEIAAAEAAVRALDAALAAAVDVAGADRARYGSTQLKADLAAVKAEARENIRGQESAHAQLTALRSAHGEAVRALARLKTGTGAATRAEIAAAEAAVRALDAALAAAVDVAGADRARYGSTQLKADLAAARAEALASIRGQIRGQEDERRRQRQAAAVDAAAKASPLPLRSATPAIPAAGA